MIMLDCGHGINIRGELLALWRFFVLFSDANNLVSYNVLGDSKIIIDWVSRKACLDVLNFDGGKRRIILLHETFFFLYYWNY